MSRGWWHQGIPRGFTSWPRWTEADGREALAMIVEANVGNGGTYRLERRRRRP